MGILGYVGLGLAESGIVCHPAQAPRKLRQLVSDLERAGFVQVSGGKGSHRRFRHPKLTGSLILSGGDGDDARHHQERMVRNALRATQE